MPYVIEQENQTARRQASWWKRLARRLRRGPESETPVPGVVYLLQAGPYYALGTTTDLDAEVSAMSRRLPFPITVIHAIYTRDSHAVLRHWQRRFARRRHHDNWFALSDDDVAAFREEGWTF